MRIAYFSNQFAVPNGHGIARYAHQLYASLQHVRPDINIIPVAAWSAEDDDGKRHLMEKYRLRLLPWGRRWTAVCWTLSGRPYIERWLHEPVDVVHAVSLGYPIATRKPYVVTVHDIGPLTHPEFFSNTHPWIMKRALKQAVRKADAFICVSQATADELESYVGRHIAKRLHVIHEGVSSLFFEKPNLASLSSIPGLTVGTVPFIVMAGKISPRKNVVRVIQAFAKLLDSLPHHLVLVGGNGWDAEDVLKNIEHPALAQRVHLLGYVSDEQLHALYGSASLYVHPSLYEGFGLPVLEAMAAGCPVVTSHLSSLPEVAGEAALLVDPTDVNAIADGMLAVCRDDAMASELIEKGRRRAALFSWEQCAEGVANVYGKIA